MWFSQRSDSPLDIVQEMFSSRMETASEVLTGNLLPGERRLELFRERRKILYQQTGGSRRTRSSRTRTRKQSGNQESTQSTDEKSFEERMQEKAPNTSQRASPKGTATGRDLEGAVKTGADKPDEERRGEDVVAGEASSPSGIPSMSEAGAAKRSELRERGDDVPV
jgi:hypothetical protein